MVNDRQALAVCCAVEPRHESSEERFGKEAEMDWGRVEGFKTAATGTKARPIVQEQVQRFRFKEEKRDSLLSRARDQRAGSLVICKQSGAARRFTRSFNDGKIVPRTKRGETEKKRKKKFQASSECRARDMKCREKREPA